MGIPELYTSAIHLKRLLDGSASPAFTPPPADVLAKLDPSFFPGLGALNENTDGLLQCPVRGCGIWVGALGRHISSKHRSLGSLRSIRVALGLGRETSLMSRTTREKYRLTRKLRKPYDQKRVVPRPARKGIRHSMATRNMRDTCPAQLAAKLDALNRKLGRSPSASDFRREYGLGTLGSVTSYFGTWNAAKAAVGLTLRLPDKKTTKALALESLRAWVEIHGTLPRVTDVESPRRTPYVPGYVAILRAFGVNTWQAAMADATVSLRQITPMSGNGYRQRDAAIPADEVPE